MVSVGGKKKSAYLISLFFVVLINASLFPGAPFLFNVAIRGLNGNDVFRIN